MNNYREIIFRGKRLSIGPYTVATSGEWVYGAYIPEAINTYINSFSKMIHVDPSTLGQYTGLRDKAGNMVFEGDIVTYSTAPGRVFEIIWDQFTWRAKAPGDLGEILEEDDNLYIEVVGNIHDNPELMEEKV